jgi:hypothetical protein
LLTAIGKIEKTAYGDAASACLEGFVKSTPRLAALIGYYPTRIPDPTQTRYSMHTSVLVHLVGHEIRVSRIPEVLGIQGKIKIVTKRIGNGVGLGGQLKLSFPSYKYENVQAGFAEADVDEYDAAAASVAWSRSLGVVRKAFRLAPEVERVRDEHSDRMCFFFASLSLSLLYQTRLERLFLSSYPLIYLFCQMSTNQTSQKQSA